MNHQLGSNGIEESLHGVHKNAFKIGRLEVFSSPFELNTHYPISTASDNPIDSFFTGLSMCKFICHNQGV